MADVRSLLKNERAARRIQHQHASYLTGGLSCTICHLQMKDALWDAHLRSTGHMMRVETESTSKKRKATDEDGEDTIRKRSKPANGLPDGFFDGPGETIEMPSRPATPSKPVAKVDEDEWAAFEADIATAEEEMKQANDAVISAPAIMAADVAKEEIAALDVEAEKEDAARKLEEELEEMESLEARVKRLREKREELRKRAVIPVVVAEPDDDGEDDDYDDEIDDGLGIY
ncbi:hypothetical protein ONS95_011757 [Cadophora gregata]|uniref:uncharacterized protein n=1 Tax=Cadophora gregata TaxID=51156 RepID=UPI0026DD445E|nr:uncharacterized protein ONS95_011757 [Cadophora gregata]KAK0120354.1 hypothetical protein ONS95_011757 [Cadophora gregata]KAK0121383.1 hypothetical protein ONS96_011556 [Cadophora gregata f. sp. sojae]